MGVLYLRRGSVCYKLLSLDGKYWGMAYMINQCTTNVWGFHPLDYWRQKGVIEGEKEKES